MNLQNISRLIFLFFVVQSCSTDDALKPNEDPKSEEPKIEEPVEQTNVAPNSFELIMVEDSSTDASLEPTLIWNEAVDADGDMVVYDLYFGENQNTTVKIAENLTEAEFTIVEALQLNTIYYWKVIAKDNKGGETESKAVFSFTTRDIGLGASAINTGAGFMPRIWHQTVVFQEKIWLIAGHGQSSNLSNGDVWSSSDGITYNLENSSAFSQAIANHRCIVFKDKIWLFDSSGLGDILSSSNGKDWVTEVEDAPFLAREKHSVTVWNNKLWVIGGYEPYQDGPSLSIKEKNDVWSSDDGLNWTLVTNDAGFPVRRGHSTVVFNNQLYLFAGSGYNSDSSTPYVRNDVWTSTDGENWTEVNTNNLFEGRNGQTAFVYKNRIWVVGGATLAPSPTIPNYIGYTPQNDVWYTEDGANWIKQAENPNFLARFDHTSTVFNDKVFVTAGWYLDEDTSTYRNDIWLIE